MPVHCAFHASRPTESLPHETCGQFSSKYWAASLEMFSHRSSTINTRRRFGQGLIFSTFGLFPSWICGFSRSLCRFIPQPECFPPSSFLPHLLVKNLQTIHAPKCKAWSGGGMIRQWSSPKSIRAFRCFSATQWNISVTGLRLALCSFLASSQHPLPGAHRGATLPLHSSLGPYSTFPAARAIIDIDDAFLASAPCSRKCLQVTLLSE